MLSKKNITVSPLVQNRWIPQNTEGHRRESSTASCAQPRFELLCGTYVKSIKSECLNPLILSSVAQLEYAIRQYGEYCHHERFHQSLDRIIEPKHTIDDGAEIVCIERLGGLLKSYHRLAA